MKDLTREQLEAFYADSLAINAILRGENERLKKHVNDYANANEALKAERDALLEKAKRYDWLVTNVREVPSQQPSEFIPLKTQYMLPYLCAYADFCGQITFDEAVDIAMSNQHANEVRQGGAEY